MSPPFGKMARSWILSHWGCRFHVRVLFTYSPSGFTTHEPEHMPSREIGMRHFEFGWLIECKVLVSNNWGTSSAILFAHNWYGFSRVTSTWPPEEEPLRWWGCMLSILRVDPHCCKRCNGNIMDGFLFTTVGGERWPDEPCQRQAELHCLQHMYRSDNQVQLWLLIFIHVLHTWSCHHFVWTWRQSCQPRRLIIPN